MDGKKEHQSQCHAIWEERETGLQDLAFSWLKRLKDASSAGRDLPSLAGASPTMWGTGVGWYGTTRTIIHSLRH